MFLKEVNNKQEWESFLAGCQEKTFLHSWNWGGFQQSLGNKIWRWGTYKDEELVSVALIIKHTAKRGCFLLVPHGPVTKLKVESSRLRQGFGGQVKLKVIENLTKNLKKLAKEEKVDFIRISPIWERSKENKKIFDDLGFRLRPLHTHPESSWKLNIEPSEEELLKGMRKTTRYLIKQAEKNTAVKVFQSFEVKDVELFYRMHLEVVKKQNFVPFSLEYLKKELSAFLPDNQVVLFFAKYNAKIIAASYSIFWSGMGFYHHGALLPDYKKIPVSYLLKWEAIKEAKRRGCKIYDFWGYSDPAKNPRHPYSGPTLFKMGFGGQKYEYVKTQDLVLSPKYWLNYIVETARKIKRGLY